MLVSHTPTYTAAVHDDLVLLSSELVTNAVVHGRPDITLRLTVTPDRIRVDVYDHGAPLVWLRPTTAVGLTSLGGRGLAIVDSIATQWGTVSTYAGKSVWFELEVGP